MTSFIQRLLAVWSHHLPAFVLAASVFSLAFAYTMQYGFGFQPCELCLMQRPPYFVGIVLSTLSLLSSPRTRGSMDGWVPAFAGTTGRICLWLCAVAFTIGGVIGAYQVGVEYHWWEGPSACSGSLAGLTAAEILARIEDAATVRCDDVAFRFMGLSMAAMNAMWSFSLAGAVAVGLISHSKNKQ